MLNAVTLFAMIACGVAGVHGDSAKQVTTTGGWSEVKFEGAVKSTFYKALGDKKYYSDEVSYRVCVKKVKKAMQQVVSGTNYLIEADGCDLTIGNPEKRTVEKQPGYGDCEPKQPCNPVSTKIRIFEQPWTNTLNVTKIEYAQNA